MNIVKEKEFYQKQRDFLAKHDCRMEQSGDCDCYYKNWMAEDGAFMIEINRVVYQDIEAETKGIKVKATVTLIETECYSTEFGSMYMYIQRP